MTARCKCGHVAEVHRMEGTRAADACAECDCRRWRRCPHDRVEIERSLFGEDVTVCAVCGTVIEREAN